MKFVCHKENLCNFVFGEHSENCLYNFVIEHYKDAIFFANHQINGQLYFIELTLSYTTFASNSVNDFPFRVYAVKKRKTKQR